MAFTGITRVTKTLTSASTWQDIDVSADIPSGATGVFGEIECISGARSAGVRKNGSTDNRTTQLDNNSHTFFAIGLDSSRIFEGFAGDNAQVKFYIDGYFTSDAVFFTNAVDKSLSATSAWTDIDISADTSTDTAVGAVIERVSSSDSLDWGLRRNGSTDNRINLSTGARHVWGFVGVDASEILEGYISNTNVDFFLNGYFKSGYTPKTNATDLSTGTTGSYVDLTALDSGATGGTIEVVTTGAQSWNIRKNGSATDIYRDGQRHHWWIGECDASQLVEGKIAATSVDFYLTGYFNASSGSSFTLTASQASFALTGQAASLKAGRKLTAAQASFALTGQSASLNRNYRLTASQATFTLSGQTTSLTAARKLTAAQVAFTVSGQVTGLLAGRKLVASQAAFTLSGQAAAFGLSKTLIAAAGTFALSGQSVSLLRAARLVAAQGAVTLTGQAAGLLRVATLTAAHAAFALTGQAANFLRWLRLVAAHGSFTLSAQPASLTLGTTAWIRVTRPTDDSYSQVSRSSDASYNPITRASDDSWNQVSRSS